jgi:hypothetical protein
MNSTVGDINSKIAEGKSFWVKTTPTKSGTFTFPKSGIVGGTQAINKTPNYSEHSDLTIKSGDDECYFVIRQGSGNFNAGVRTELDANLYFGGHDNEIVSFHDNGGYASGKVMDITSSWKYATIMTKHAGTTNTMYITDNTTNSTTHNSYIYEYFHKGYNRWFRFAQGFTSRIKPSGQNLDTPNADGWHYGVQIRWMKTGKVIVTPPIKRTRSAIDINTTIYPNPSIDGNVRISTSNDSTMVTIYDIAGKVLGAEYGSNVQFTDLSKGMYIIRVTMNGEAIKTEKLIIK